jgi:hypothetical protein
MILICGMKARTNGDVELTLKSHVLDRSLLSLDTATSIKRGDVSEIMRSCKGFHM